VAAQVNRLPHPSADGCQASRCTWQRHSRVIGVAAAENIGISLIRGSPCNCQPDLREKAGRFKALRSEGRIYKRATHQARMMPGVLALNPGDIEGFSRM